MSAALLWFGGPVFDGERLLDGHGVLVDGTSVLAVGPLERLEGRGEPRDTGGKVLAPGFVDLQVNGGGGLMLGDAPSVEGIGTIARAHRSLGTGWLFPTLISDRPEVQAAVIDAVARSIELGVEGVAGLHLEGPHLSVSRAGAHDPANLRPMRAADREALIAAKARLPALIVTLAPEAAGVDDVAALSAAGIIVALGHTEADYDTARRYFAAGARMVTHLFNAMPPILHRAPGLAGAALATEGVVSGLIADGHHVHESVLGMAIRGARGSALLVSDAMAVAGTELAEFALGGRTIHRGGGRLTLADGTLAGADLDLARAVRVVTQAGIPLENALSMATRMPARAVGLDGAGNLQPGATSLIRLDLEAGRATPLLGERHTV